MSKLSAVPAPSRAGTAAPTSERDRGMDKDYGRCEQCNRTSGKRRMRGLCSTCYAKLLTSPDFVPMRRPLVAIDERLLKNVAAGYGGCWIWTSGLTPAGYGTLVVTRDRVRITHLAHRLSYETFVGAIPEGLHIDHLCRVRRCINPKHLEPVTSQENTLRSPITVAAKYAARTHCGAGHEFTPENTRWKKRTDNPEKTYRACKTCERNRLRARRGAVAR